MNNPTYEPGLPCEGCGNPTGLAHHDYCYSCRRQRKAERAMEWADIRRDQIKDGEE